MQVADLELKGHTLVKGGGGGDTLAKKFRGTTALGS